MRRHYFTSAVTATILFLVLLLALPACSSKPVGQGTATPQGLYKIPTKQATTATSATTPWQSERPIKEPLKATTSTTEAVSVGDLATQQVKVVIPPGTLSAGTVVTVTSIENAPPMSSSVGTPVGAPVSISVGDKPVRLNQLMTITLKFDRSKLPAGTQADSLWATFYDGKAWQPFRPDSVDLQAGTLTFTTDHLTGFGTVKIDVEEQIAQIIHSKVAAEVIQKDVLNNVTDQLAGQAIDHILVDRLGMKEEGWKTKVLQSLLKDDEWKDISDQMKDKDFDGVKLAETINVFVGKKIAENVDASALSEALVHVSGGADKIKLASEAAGAIAGGDYAGAGRMIAEGYASSTVVYKVVKTASEVIDWRIELWKDGKIESAYKAYRDGASTDNPNGYDLPPRDFAALWGQVKGIDTRLEGEAVRREETRRQREGLKPLTGAEAAGIRAGVQADMKKQFEDRAKQDDQIAKEEAEAKKLLAYPDMRRLLDQTIYFDSSYTMERKVNVILRVRDQILRDTAGKTLKNEEGKGVGVTNQDIVDLIRAHRGQANATEGSKAYYALLKKKFGIGLAAAVATTPAPTAAVEAVIAIPNPYTLGAFSEPYAAFGKPANPITVRLSGSIKGDASLKFEGTEFYSMYGGERDVIAFVYSIPANATKSSLDFEGLVIPVSAEPANKTVKFIGTKPQNETTTFTDDATYTWVGWGGSVWSFGPMKMTYSPAGENPNYPNFDWTAGKSLNCKRCVLLDANRNGEGTTREQAGGVMFKIEFRSQRVKQGRDMQTGGLGLPNAPYPGQIPGSQAIVIRLVKR